MQACPSQAFTNVKSSLQTSCAIDSAIGMRSDVDECQRRISSHAKAGAFLPLPFRSLGTICPKRWSCAKMRLSGSISFNAP
jgi:hypothetical protein